MINVGINVMKMTRSYSVVDWAWLLNVGRIGLVDGCWLAADDGLLLVLGYEWWSVDQVWISFVIAGCWSL